MSSYPSENTKDPYLPGSQIRTYPEVIDLFHSDQHVPQALPCLPLARQIKYFERDLRHERPVDARVQRD